MGGFKEPRYEKYPEYTLAELTGIRNENILNERVNDLREAIFELERIEYGDSIYDAYFGTTQGEALFKTKVEERRKDIEELRRSLERRMRRRHGRKDASLIQMPSEMDIEELDLETEQHLRELTLSVSNEINLKTKERIEMALHALNINYWPAKDVNGNDSFVIDYPKDLEIMRRVFSEEYFLNYRESLIKRLQEAKDATERHELENRVRKITLAMEKPGGHLAEHGYRTEVNPIRALYAFGGLPMQKAHKKDLGKDMAIDRDIERKRKARSGEDDQEEVEALDEILFGNAERFSVGAYTVRSDEDQEWVDFEEEADEPESFEGRIPAVANLPYYKKYVWVSKEKFEAYAKTHGITHSASDVTGKHILIDSTNKRVVSKAERELTFLAARDWATGNKEAVAALKEVLLQSRNFILWNIRILNDLHLKYLSNVDNEVLFQMGNLAVMRAVQRYAPEIATSGHHLAFLRANIEGYIRRMYFKGLGIDNSAKQISEPAHLRQMRKQVDDIKDDLWSKNPARKTEDIEVVRELINRGILNDFLGTNFDNMTREEIFSEYSRVLGRYQKYLEKILYYYDEVPHGTVREEDTVNFHHPHRYGDPDYPAGPDAEYDSKQLSELIRFMLLSLTSREQRVIMMRFGIGQFGTKHAYGIWKREQRRQQSDEGMQKTINDHGATLEEIGDVFGVSKERIRQVEAKALRKMMHPSRSRVVKWFLPEHSRYHPLQEARRSKQQLEDRYRQD